MSALLALIDEEQCIGCTKCIKACPVDAIVGSENWLHTVISEECIGCKLCITPCPVDCIELVPAPDELKPKAKDFILARAKSKKLREQADNDHIIMQLEQKTHEIKQDYIKAALSRAKNKKNQ